MKFKKGNYVVEVTDPNTFSVFIREGFKKVEEKPKEDK
ncbi:hypothetical protein Clo1100_2433 [Clostridium sp. BNL1100]|nr:hypothetical protein Clo1100_2433 [Clostridium sp. BNL1100]